MLATNLRSLLKKTLKLIEHREIAGWQPTDRRLTPYQILAGENGQMAANTALQNIEGVQRHRRHISQMRLLNARSPPRICCLHVSDSSRYVTDQPIIEKETLHGRKCCMPENCCMPLKELPALLFSHRDDRNIHPGLNGLSFIIKLANKLCSLCLTPNQPVKGKQNQWCCRRELQMGGLLPNCRLSSAHKPFQIVKTRYHCKAILATLLSNAKPREQRNQDNSWKVDIISYDRTSVRYYINKI